MTHRLQLLEEENGEMKISVSRLKSQTEKLDQVSGTLLFACVLLSFVSTLNYLEHVMVRSGNVPTWLKRTDRN